MKKYEEVFLKLAQKLGYKVMFVPTKEYEILEEMLDLACERLSDIENHVIRGQYRSTPQAWKEYLKQLVKDERLFIDEDDDEDEWI